MSNYKVSVWITAEDKASKVLWDLNNKMQSVQWNFNNTSTAVSWMTSKMMWLYAVVWTAIAWVWALWANMLATAWKFEKFESILTNTMWSVSEAKNAMQMLKDVSVKTPFELDKITESYVKLVNRWFKPTQQEIIQLWDLSSSLWKDLDMLVEAMLDAQTWEFERLKEFGVRAQASWNQVAFTFKGVTTTVDKTDDAIRNYILWLWKLKWVEWSMIAQSNTYEWKLSNMKDARTNLSATIWKVFLPVAKNAIQATTDMMNRLNDNIKVVTDRGWSTNANVVMIAEAFKYLQWAASWLPSIGSLFSWAMSAVAKSINYVFPMIWALSAGLQKLYWYAKQATWADQKAMTNALTQSWSMAVAPWLYADRIKQQLASWSLWLKWPSIWWWWGGIWWLPKSWGWGWWKADKEAEKAKERQIQLEKELIKTTNQRIQQVEALNISEWKKAELVLKINEEAQAKLKEIRSSDEENQMNSFEKIAEKAKEKIEKMKENYKWLYEAINNAIDKTQNEVDKLNDQIKDWTEKIKTLKESLWELWKDTTKNLSDRFVEATKELANLQQEIWKVDSMSEQLDIQNKINSIRNELSYIWQTVDKPTLDKAMWFDQLSPAEKIVEKANQKKAEIELEIQWEQTRIDELMKKKDDEMKKLQNFNEAKMKLEKDYTKRYKDELNERFIAFSDYVAKISSLWWWDKKETSSIITSAINWARANWWPVIAWSSYLVWENWPEIFKPSSSWSIVSNWSIWWVTVNINGVNISNWMDLIDFKQQVEQVIVSSVRNLQAWLI